MKHWQYLSILKNVWIDCDERQAVQMNHFNYRIRLVK